MLVIIDLAGNDVYRSSKPGVQGGAILGVSMLLDYEGDDVYEAQDIAQGSAIAGVGILIDYKGNDRYHGLRRVQGHALGGLGILIDKEGNDDYHAAMWAQGHGGPLGIRPVGRPQRQRPLLLRRHVARFLSRNARL